MVATGSLDAQLHLYISLPVCCAQVERAARTLHSARACPARAEAREAPQPPPAAPTLAAHAIC